MTAKLIIGDVRAVLASLAPASVDLVLSSPPFLAVRSYLPDGHPDKALEIGSEATPADYLDTLLDVTEACAHVLTPHGSLVFELGDTYSGSGGAGGDYGSDGMRGGQQKFKGSALADRKNKVLRADGNRLQQGPGWPLDKSLCGIPTLFAWSLAYGRNLLRPERSTPPWRIRTLKPWIRTNPPVGALGDKERPATSYVVVATKAKDRWFDLDAVRTGLVPDRDLKRSGFNRGAPGYHTDGDDAPIKWNPAGAPPLDWWCHVDAVLDAELARRAKDAGKPQTGNNSPKRRLTMQGGEYEPYEGSNPGATGAHLRRALQAAGILHLEEAIDQSPGGYSGPHYAVWPKELVALLLEEMCPRRVCRTCGQPSRRLTEANPDAEKRTISAETEQAERERMNEWQTNRGNGQYQMPRDREGERTVNRDVFTTGWTTCGCPSVDGIRLDGFHTGAGWRPGVVLDPFVGSGTTLMVATGHGRDAIGVDIDERSADLARERVGMFLDVEYAAVGDSGSAA